MSVRIHQLSKRIGIENKELLTLLQERGYSVTSASSSIDNISAESLVDEFSRKTDEETAEITKAAGEAAEAGHKEEETGEAGEDAAKAPPAPPKPSVNLPPGVFVKSAADIQREREEKAEAKKAEATAAAKPAPAPPPAPKTPPVVSRPSVPPPPPPPPVNKPSAPEAKSPPPVKPAPPASSGGPIPPVKPAPTPPVKPAPTPMVKPAPTHPVKSAPTPPVKSAPTPPHVAAGRAPVIPPRPNPVPPPPPPAADQAKPGGEPSGEISSETGLDGGAPVDDVNVIQIKPPIVVRDFAGMIGLKPFRLISELMEMGIFASMNQVIEETVATDIAARHGFLLDIRHRGEQQSAAEKKKAIQEDEAKYLEPRPPVVCILGHVDHGKTTLLDNIRKANVVGGEFGGITQHIGAYQVEAAGKKLTFLDTPGHAAFSQMRARGANVTDIVILIVAADDGFMPQTDEALKHAQNAKVPVIVAINKMDSKGANPDRVKKQMQERGIAPEEWGGETITVGISALKGEGISDLLDMVVLQADVLELKANPKGAASGMIIESAIEIGRGPMATVIVQKGTLKNGDALVCGGEYCKVRAMFDENGRQVKAAPPSTPVRVIGWSGAPESGDEFTAVKNEREAKRLAEEAAHEARKEDAIAAPAPRANTLDDLFSKIASQKKKTLYLVVRCDVHGSMEAVCSTLYGIKSDKVDIDIVQSDVGMISQRDVLMASTAKAAIIGFNVKMENGVKNAAKHHSVTVQTFNIIYELIDAVKIMMAEQLDPEVKEIKLGGAEVRQVFPVSRGMAAGCLVTEGKIQRNANCRVVRGGQAVYTGKVSTLKRFKDDANDVRAGYECGIRAGEFNDYEPGDLIECFEIQHVRASL